MKRQKIKGSKVLVINALRKEEHISHFTLNESVALAQELDIPVAYFTHMSHQIGKHEEVNKTLPDNLQLAWDGLTLEF